MKIARASLATALVLAACSSPPPATPEATPPTAPAPVVPPPVAPTDAGATAPVPAGSDASAPQTQANDDDKLSPRERLMRSHFKEAAMIRKAVIDGAIADAVAPAEKLANNEGLGKIEPSWQSSIDVLQYAAKRIQHGSDVPAVAAAISDIGIACGACHKAAGGPTPKVEAAPAGDGTLAGRMRRHSWAAERLWEGIYAASDASWKAGASALTADPFPKEVLDKGGVHARSEASRFKKIAATLGDKKKPEDRGQAYADLLQTCSACHVVTRPKK